MPPVRVLSGVRVVIIPATHPYRHAQRRASRDFRIDQTRVPKYPLDGVMAIQAAYCRRSTTSPSPRHLEHHSPSMAMVPRIHIVHARARGCRPACIPVANLLEPAGERPFLRIQPRKRERVHPFYTCAHAAYVCSILDHASTRQPDLKVQPSSTLHSHADGR